MANELVFYTNPMSRGRLVRWMLEEIGVPYRTEILEYGPALQSPEYLAINPMGKVPAIEHGAVVVTECAAICAYLADVFPEAGLAPPPGKRGAYYRWLFFGAGVLEAAVVNRFLGFEPNADQERMIGYGSYARTMDALAKAVSGGEFITGPQFTAADLYIGSSLSFGMQIGSVEKRPEFEAYAARVIDRPAFRKAQELDGPIALPNQE